MLTHSSCPFMSLSVTQSQFEHHARSLSLPFALSIPQRQLKQHRRMTGSTDVVPEFPFVSLAVFVDDMRREHTKGTLPQWQVVSLQWVCSPFLHCSVALFAHRVMVRCACEMMGWLCTYSHIVFLNNSRLESWCETLVR